jgi:hypothetical protein
MTSSEQDFRTRPRRAQWDVLGVGLLLLGFLVLVFVGWALRSNRATRDQAAASVDRARRDLHDLERLVKAASGGRGAERGCPGLSRRSRSSTTSHRGDRCALL